MEIIKYFTSESFDKAGFVNLLRKMNVSAYVVDTGIILDRDEFNNIPLGELPIWAFENREDINSIFHTRPATDEENIPTYKYSICAGGEVLAQVDSIEEAIQYITDSIVIVDNETGEIV
jgi:hypothetical protein